ncbi:ABZJ_00895 family protein [Ensifer sp.]|jgi:hypothetical protein|uniref:ABZJ_00895 family protein n=1 Tax=Ensifer sp. TaxID=1872086 RepID=UPI002E14582D|nr:ABZJ_00895 family protein [Ensifer sp.]
MQPTASLTAYYRYFALYCFAVMVVCLVGMIAYEYNFGPIPSAAQYGLWFAQVICPAAATAYRFVQHHRRCPTKDEKAKLARVSLALAVAINAIPLLAIVGWICVMAFIVGDPDFQIVYYAYRQQAVWLLVSADAMFWIVVACGVAMFFLASYFLIRSQYGRSAQKLAARMFPQ